MIKKEIENYIKKHTSILPLSFFELEYKIKNITINENRVFKKVQSKKYSSDSFPVYKFYKPISRF